VGGAPTGLFPDCCAVGNDSAFFCTGTLIAPNLVVTAKHCDTVSRVFLKGRDISFLPAGEVIRVKRQIPHETADIQVLVLETDSTVKPRHVARTNEVDTPSLATVVGFGTVNFDGTSGFGLKRRVTVPIMSLDCSSQEDQNDFRCVAETEIVAGHRGLWKDTCKGDSGGPLYIQGPGGQFFLLGATSRGTGEPGPICGQGGIYVRLWTKDHVSAGRFRSPC
jgi:secreted trypsin-like serine protease